MERIEQSNKTLIIYSPYREDSKFTGWDKGSLRPALLVPSTSMAYLFLVASLLFGFPLLTAYYNVDSSFYFLVVIPYLLLSITIGLFIIKRSQKLKPEDIVSFMNSHSTGQSKLVATFNSFPLYGIMILVGTSMIMYSLIRYLVLSTYPLPAPRVIGPLGQLYIIILLVSSILAFSRIFYRLIPVLRKILHQKEYALMALIASLSFAVVYLILVNQLIISGYNALGTVPPPSGSYPYASVMVPGVREPLIDLVYLPIVIVQLSPQVNLILVPFEMVFVTILSILVATNVVLAHYLISNSGLKCSTKGTALSTGGSILGLTATCPTCLAPTFISVIFGGVTAAEAVYSNIYGVVLPTLLSVVTLILSIIYLRNDLKKRGLA